MYASAHLHDVGWYGVLNDGLTFVEVRAGWTVAPGDADDVSVCGAHKWQSYYLVFADGSACGTLSGDRSSIGNFS